MTPGEGGFSARDLAVAGDALRAARVLLDAGLAADAVARLYYAAFHAARAALEVGGLHAKTHGGQVTLFDRAFGSGSDLERWLKARLAADYGREPFAVPIETIEAEVEAVGAFVERCRTIVDEALARGADEPDPDPDL